MVSMTVPQYRRHECTLGGHVVHLQPLWAEILAGMLISHPDRFVSAAALIECVWPDLDAEPDWALGCLQKCIHFMRRLGVPIENRHGYGYRIPRSARGQSDLALSA